MTTIATTERLPALTTTQREVFVYLYEHARDCGYQPSCREMCERFGWSSPNGAQQHLKAIARKGWIGPRATGTHRGESRAVEILARPDGRPFDGFADKGTDGSAS